MLSVFLFKCLNTVVVVYTSINSLQFMVRSRRCEDQRRARYRTGDWNKFQHAGSNKVYICGFTRQTGPWKPSLTASRKNLLTSDGFFLRFCHDSCSFKCTSYHWWLKIHTPTKLATPHLRLKLKGLGSSFPRNNMAWPVVMRGWGGGCQRGWGCPAKPADGRQKEQHFVAPWAHI